MGKSSKKRLSTTEAKPKSKKSRYETDEDEENVSSDSESDNTSQSKNTKKASKSRGNKKRNETVVKGGRGDDGEKSDESESDDETLVNVAKRSKTSPLSGKDAESSENESVATDTQEKKLDEVSESLIVFWSWLSRFPIFCTFDCYNATLFGSVKLFP